MKHITHLSFTRLKALAHSPLALARYIDQKKERTKAMDEGRLLDCLLFEPDKVEERFYIIPKINRQTKAGKAQFESEIKKAGKRIVVNQNQYDDAKRLEEAIRMNSTVAFSGLLNPELFKFQEKVEFYLNGFKHIGVKDADGEDRNGQRVIWDLKRMGAKSGEKLVRSAIRNELYDLQAAIYCHPFDSQNIDVKYYIIAVDNDGYVTPFEIGRDARNQARVLWFRLIKAAHHCNMVGLDQGPEFLAGQNGFFQF